MLVRYQTSLKGNMTVILGSDSEKWILNAITNQSWISFYQGTIKVLKEHRAEVKHGSAYLLISYLLICWF